MSSGQPYEERARRRRIPRQLLKIATIAIVAAGGLGVTVSASAATLTPTPPTTPPVTPPVTPTETATETPTVTATPAPTETPTASPAPAELPPINPWGFAGTMHGEFSVATKDGCGTVTLLTQTGQVTALADGSITVRSQDGFEQTYTIDESTRQPRVRLRDGEESRIQQDGWVSVTATTDGQTARAAYLLDLSQPMRLHPQDKSGWRRAKQWWGIVPNWQTPTPCPTPTQTSTPPPTDTPTTVPTQTPTEIPTEPPAESPTETPTGAPAETPTQPPVETPAPTPTS
ncbi:hypothetical protein [Nonomuraea rubra]|uniref:Outer membrane biosynthesis protein TonB n=1 Tax=Nonomuraea rubra TaxID=46180 RepID=A0A7X0U0Z1_9ACTN|nr:hypothetical protein [Nonomuraea rubra]MBB6551038.1 outer membrane biosynthesis protein TonB [Nonomuraea rubra]